MGTLYGNSFNSALENGTAIAVLWDSANFFSSGFVDPADCDRSRRWCYSRKPPLEGALRLNDLVSHCVAHQLADRVAVQTSHDVRPMRFCRFNAKPELDRHFLAAFAFRQELHNLPLTRCQTRSRPLIPCVLGILAVQVTILDNLSHFGGKVRFIVAHRIDGRDQIAPRVRFQHISLCSYVKHLAHQRIRFMDRDDQDFCPYLTLCDLPRRLQSIEHRHADVEHGDFGFYFFGFLDRLPPVIRLGGYTPARLGFDNRAHASAY